MKPKPSWISVNRLLLALGLGVLALPTPNLAGSSIDMVAVAQQTEQGKKLTPPTPQQPVYYIAYDAGYVEAARSIGGLTPPSPSLVGQALRTSLTTAGYETATTQHAPSLVLVYLHGYIGSNSSSTSSEDFLARMDLVATNELARRVLDYRLYANDGFAVPEVRDTFDFSRTPRYFVIVSAYDYSDLTRQTPTLLWRVKLSAQENSGALSEIVPALAGASTPYLGRDLPNRQVGPLTPLTAKGTGDGLTTAPSPWLFPRPAVDKIDARLMRALLQQERARSAGITLPNANATSAPQPVLPPELAAHIAAYQQEKAALEGLLAERIKAQPSGQDLQAVINAFKEEQAPRIAAFSKQGDSLRDELARFRAANAHGTTDATLDSLMKEFPSKSQHLEPTAATPH